MRKHRTKVTWLPSYSELTVVVPVGGDAYNIAGIEFSIPLASGQAPVTGVFPIVEDTPQEGNASRQVSLDWILGSEYILQRIVGKCFVALENTEADKFVAAAVTAGFFVARAESNSPTAPVGYPTEASVEGFNNYSPMARDALREPWIWRRTWILGSPGSNSALSTVPAQAAWNAYPSSNAYYGSVADGPHIDAKSHRRVGNDDRLFFGITAAHYPFDDLVGTLNIRGYLDTRVLGTLVKAHNKSTF